MFFEVELKRESYVTYTIRADNPDEAEALAWEELERNNPREDGFWSVESIEDVGEA
tara:strand:+ start:1768 stop:1935 length:168 start_codon:yes stop_codon:yes gene_type:complete